GGSFHGPVEHARYELFVDGASSACPLWRLRKAVLREGPREALFDEPEAAATVVGEAARVVADALGEIRHVGGRVHIALHDDVGALVHAVTPVRFEAVARTDREEVGLHRRAGDLDARLGEPHDGRAHETRARMEDVIVLRATELLDAAVVPHAFGLL